MKKFIKILDRTQSIIGISFLFAFFVVIIIQIAARYMGISLIWTVELASNTFIWATFMGAAVMVNRREHFNFDFLLRKVKGKTKTSINVINDVILILFNVGIFVYGLQVTQNFWDYTWTSIPELKMGYVWISIPIMGATMILYSLSHLVNHIKEFKGKEVTE